MQIIEFNGLPGAGKTTIANQLKYELESKGYSCISSFKQESLFILMFYCLRYPSCLQLLYKLFRLSKNAINDKVNRGIVLLIVHYYQQYLLSKKAKEDFCIVDQGIIQGIISLFHTRELSDSELLKSISSTIMKHISFWRVDCIVNESFSFDRIRTRTPAGSRLEKLNDEALLLAFRTQAINFSVVRDAFSSAYNSQSIVLDTANNVDSNVQIIIKEIL